MKKLATLLAVFTLTFSMQSHAEGWLDSLKSMIGMGEETQETSPSAGAMVGQLLENLDVNQQQAEGGLGAIFNYAKSNMSSEKFSQIADTLPGLGDLLNAAPDVSNVAGEGGLGGLLDKASEYNESVKAINDVKKQFEALGLDTDMIMKFVKQAQAYLDTEEGQKAKQYLTESVSKLLG